MTLTDAAIAPTGSYELRLGFPPRFGVNITASDLLAHVTTPSAPGEMSKTAAQGAVYQFDASQFLLTVDQGKIVVTGTTNETIDLSEEPVGGASPAGTFGTFTFSALGTNGPYTHLGAVLDMPIRIMETAESESGGMSVDLELIARVQAHATFYVAFDGISGDFDEDGDVDAADLAQWEGDFGVNGLSDADNDGDSDGADFLTWQREVSGPPVAGVPEPRGMLLCIVGAATAAIARERRRRQAASR